MMRQFVAAGFSVPLIDTLALKAMEVAEGIRTGPAVNDQHVWIERIVRDAAARFESSIFLVGGWDWRMSDGTLTQRRTANLLEDPTPRHLANQCESVLAVWKAQGRRAEDCWFEIGNELDGSYWKHHLGEFFELTMVCYDRVRSISPLSPFITGSTMNFNDGGPFWWKKAGFEVLDELCRFRWPKDTLQGLHPYRTKCKQKDWPSWDDSDHALGKLREVLRGRQVAITEMGWHSGSSFSDAEIAAFTMDEIDMWEMFGAACYVGYQIQDAPKPNNFGEGGFGAYTSVVDGLLEKPVARAMRNALALRKV